MTKENELPKDKSLDPVVLLLLFGIYFVCSYLAGHSVFELVYGLILIFYYFKVRIFQKKTM